MDDEWSVNANEALTLSLVRPSCDGDVEGGSAGGNGSLKTIASFQPKFTYSLFGDEEQIFGFKGLKIHLQFNASDLRPNLSISSSKKFTRVAEVEPTDVFSIMQGILPPVAFQKHGDFRRAIRSIPDTWTPPGQLVKAFDINGASYEVWRGNLADEAVKQLVKRIQIVVLLFIEGGSYIGVDADGKDERQSSLARWTVYFLYKKETDAAIPCGPKYVFQGYSTVYDFWLYQQSTPPATPEADSATPAHAVNKTWELPQTPLPLTKLPRRSRISQFVILPPFQGKGAGAVLYETIFELQMKDFSVKEITVEDPNEAFDRLRDLCDIRYLRTNEPAFANLRINPDVQVPDKGGILHDSTEVSLRGQPTPGVKGIIDAQALESIRVKHKIAPRQFSRLVEMHLMSLLPASVRPHTDSLSAKRPAATNGDRHVYSLWKLLLKQRLYRRNSTILGEFEVPERIAKLDETLGNVEWEYAQILERLEQTSANANEKRKLEVNPGDSPSSKKVRLEVA